MKKAELEQLAADFVSKCREWGWQWQADGDVVTVIKRFPAGDSQAYAIADGEGYDLLSMCPLRGGSVWGTDGGSVGGFVGLQGGYYKINKSGSGGKQFCKLVNKAR